MSRVDPFHSAGALARVYHDRSECVGGRRIPIATRRAGTCNRKRLLCDTCKRWGETRGPVTCAVGRCRCPMPR